MTIREDLLAYLKLDISKCDIRFSQSSVGEATGKTPQELAEAWTSTFFACDEGKDYKDYLKTFEWDMKAEFTKWRFGYRCAICNDGQNLQVHHRTYDRVLFTEFRVCAELICDLTCLCADCHKKYHDNLNANDNSNMLE